MRRVSLMLVVTMLAAATAMAAPQNPCNPCSKKKAQNPCNPCAKKAQNPCNPCAAKAAKVRGGRRTVEGYIGDSQCGLEHPMGMGDAKACTLKCVEGGGKFVLADRVNKVVYQLDAKSQEKARQHAGQKVKVTGVVTAKTQTIRVSSIEALP